MIIYVHLTFGKLVAKEIDSIIFPDEAENNYSIMITNNM